MQARTHSSAVGLFIALASALTFGTSGAFARSLLDAGWSPAAAVTVRASVATAFLAIPAILALRGRWHVLFRAWRTLLLFGVVAVALTQLAYFQAIQHVSVGVALLLEYLGVILVVIWLWVRHGQRPRPLSIAGGVLAIVGLIGVLDVVSGATISLVGVAWGLLAAVGLATYFVVSADTNNDLPPVALAAAGLLTGALTLGLAGAVGIVDMRMTTADVTLAGFSAPWWLLILGLGLISTALAYSLGIGAARILGSKLASFVGLTEVLFAVLIAWLLLGQLPGFMQLIGGLLILAGVVAVKWDETVAARQAQRWPVRASDGITHAPAANGTGPSNNGSAVSRIQ